MIYAFFCSLDKDVQLKDADHIRVGAPSLSDDVPVETPRFHCGRFFGMVVVSSIPSNTLPLGP